MGLFDLLEKTVTAAITLPIAIVHDTVTMGGALTDRDRPMTVDVARIVVDAAERAVKGE